MTRHDITPGAAVAEPCEVPHLHPRDTAARRGSLMSAVAVRDVADTFRNWVGSNAEAIVSEEFTKLDSDHGIDSFLSIIGNQGLEYLEENLTLEWDSQTYFWPAVIKLILRVWFGDHQCLGHRNLLEFSTDTVALSNEVLAFTITAVSPSPHQLLNH